jgi:hypothetical protein
MFDKWIKRGRDVSRPRDEGQNKKRGTDIERTTCRLGRGVRQIIVRTGSV